MTAMYSRRSRERYLALGRASLPRVDVEDFRAFLGPAVDVRARTLGQRLARLDRRFLVTVQSALAGQAAADREVTFVARVLALVVVGLRRPHRAHRERRRVRLRVVDRDAILEHLGGDAAGALRRAHVRAVRGAADAGAILEALALDDERVALPVAARVARELRDLGNRRLVEANDARLVDHLVGDRHDARRLEDLDAVAVNRGVHAVRDTATDAAVVQREIVERIEAVVGERAVSGSSALASRI